MAKLTSHVLDLVNGCPGENIRVDLYKLDSGSLIFIRSSTTNEDGRITEFSAYSLNPGIYQLKFHVAKYFSFFNLEQPKPEFLNEVVIQFGIAAEDEHYHVPLLLSTYGYSTYRGS